MIYPIDQTITPAEEKRALKAVYGDTLTFSVALADAPQEGDEYAAVIDFERIVFPVGREVCGMADGVATASESPAETENAGKVEFSVSLATARMQKWASSLLRPEPICLQVVRIRDGVQTTLILDTILAIPSVIDGNATVQQGDPIQALLAEKLDKPENGGTAGNVVSLNADGETIWADPASTGDAGRAVEIHNAAANAHSALFAGKMDAPQGAGMEGDAVVMGSNGNAVWGMPWRTMPVTAIPAATVAATLTDNAAYTHSPASAPVYALPQVTDGATTHEITVEVLYSASALSCAFTDYAGNAIAPLEMAGTITAGVAVLYLCRWSVAKNQWVIMPIMEG